ncbi:hypothetical protein CK503_08210 [Aliifodinibius salipaludis]|uniref:TonB-dependent receptor plug domain-containing protein n=1 Tax=Fodinibius salipaludis TaxID=2032627 RepID=A0A2A2GBD5_9BACT|nr:SusC/RagA family TonB-linked outer membrane protein [Aliifodinibius salipaludis]PAU94187.1 hypothetical protein CK503_08210 [Aliifodinibius salipaludis]
MVKKLLSLFTLCLIFSATAFAQSGTITGTVTDESSGETLPSVNVYVVELQRGAATNAQGEFTIEGVEYGTYTVRASFVGYNTFEQEVTVDQSTVTLDIQLASSQMRLDEVVVTALGEEVSQRQVSFSTQEVGDEELNISQNSNVKTSLAGKVSGVQIVGQAGSKLGSFGDIRIRGAISLTNELAEPLYVLDGVPIENPNIIDMNNVQEVSVLKGPNATALYGQRGENGVVILTSKSGSGTGASVEINSSTTFDRVAYLPNFQNQYGKGYYASDGDPSTSGGFATIEAGGTSPFGAPYPSYLDELDGERYIAYGYADESWGPEFDGEPYAPWYSWYPDSPYYGETQPWDASPNNIKNFYDTGVTNKSSIAVNYNTERSNTRLTFTNLAQNGIIPSSSLDKKQLGGNFSYDVTDDFNVGVKVNYSTQGVIGDVRDDGYGNQTSGSFNSWFARNLEMDKMQELKDLETPEGYHASWNAWGPGYMGFGGGYKKPAFWYNPYTWMDRYDIKRDTDNLLMNVDLSYQLTENIELVGNASSTSESYNRRFEMPYSLTKSADQTGSFYNYWVNSFGELSDEINEHNFSSRLKYDADYGDFSVNGFAGAQMRIEQYKMFQADMGQTNITYGGLNVPDLYNFANSREEVIPVEDNWDKQVLSFFGKATIGYQDYLFLDATYRQDYSSALPEGNNGYGYPSVGLSFVFTEFMDNDILTYGKVRAGYAQVGNDVGAELINQTYNVRQIPYRHAVTGQPKTLLSTSSTLVDEGIEPALNSSFEVGADLEFYDNVFGLDLTYYNEKRENEIVTASMSSGTGYTGLLTNAGASEREGVEVSFRATPVQNQDLRWDATVNWAMNETIVTALPEGVSSYELGSNSAFGYISLTHRLGEEWGQLRGPGIARNDEGQPILNDDGLYVVEQNKYFGSVLPDWTGGIINTVSYKGLQLSASIDYQKGGKFFSLTEQWGGYSGLTEETAGTNDRGGKIRDYPSEGGGVHVTGVDQQGNSVDTYVGAYSYFSQFQANTIAEPFINDADFVKLRELAINYTLPKQWTGNFINSATIGVVGRNLWMIAVADNNTHNWDPSELAETYGENGQLPGTRSYGFNVKVTF